MTTDNFQTYRIASKDNDTLASLHVSLCPEADIAICTVNFSFTILGASLPDPNVLDRAMEQARETCCRILTGQVRGSR